MKAYIRYFNLTVQSMMQFRANFIISFFTGFLFDYVKVAIWYAIMYFQFDRIQPVVIENTMKYMILTSSFSLLFKCFGQGMLSQKIIDGSLERDMLYPVSVIGLSFASGFGTVVVEFVKTSCVSFLILTLLYSVKWTFHLIPFLGMILLLVLGLIIQFLMIIIIELLAFWTVETRSLHSLWDAVYKFFGGFLMPLWFFPEKMQRIMDYLPFKNIVNQPVECYISSYNLHQILLSALISIIWILVFYFIVYRLWKRGTRRMMVNGG